MNVGISDLTRALVAFAGVPQHAETVGSAPPVRTAAVDIPRQTGEHEDRRQGGDGPFLHQVWQPHRCKVSARGQCHAHTVASKTRTVLVGPPAA